MSPDTQSVAPYGFESYYGRPVLKEPAWKTPDVPLYLFLGGLSGASSVLAAAADLTGRPGLARASRVTAAAGVLSSLGALVHDLGRPARFLNMLRVVKPTSPMSMGSWTIATFGPLAVGAAASELTGVLTAAGRAAGIGAAALGPAMATYTAVLLADTAIPAWHDAHAELPFVFGGSAMAAAAGAALAAAPLTESGPATRMALAGASMEIASTQIMTRRLGLSGEPYSPGRAGKLMLTAKTLTAAGAAGAVLGRRSRAFSAAAGACLVAGSAALRFAVFDAGVQSARDPRYTVIPQRERAARRAAGTSGE
ncbi:MAG TPA: NrfD/PsrC family molybdoenzyme membrane anchor subunit [Streptosporangiaceae bacterium]|nr:NrfD/PsrC family molybdoenzyme membrane anchor subunit [Streptosporangiaceae bacterium]